MFVNIRGHRINLDKVCVYRDEFDMGGPTLFIRYQALDKPITITFNTKEDLDFVLAELDKLTNSFNIITPPLNMKTVEE